MDEWCTRTHGESGLSARVKASTVSQAQAEQDTVDFLAQHVPANTSPMCGNSICQDRRFLARYMPKLEAHFHYRNLDVSTLKELARRWNPQALKGFRKKAAHLALDDIVESIAELKHYQSTFIKMP